MNVKFLNYRMRSLKMSENYKPSIFIQDLLLIKNSQSQNFEKLGLLAIKGSHFR